MKSGELFMDMTRLNKSYTTALRLKCPSSKDRLHDMVRGVANV